MLISDPVDAYSEKSAKRRLLARGNEAVAWAAVEAQVDFFSHYPGSPVNQVEPLLKKIDRDHGLGITFNDALNEHVATLAAAGASYCGARSMVVMKHVGLNIAADPINYLGYTGVKGGMVIVVGTDPGANSSTGEEDPHWFVPQVGFPLFEPKNIQDIQKYTLRAFEISEKYEIPVFLFIPGRIAYHSDSIEIPQEPKPSGRQFLFEKEPSRYVNVGQRAVANHRKLLEKVERIGRQESFLQNYFSTHAKTGLITRGVTFGHTFESIKRLGIEDEVHLLNVEMVSPLPIDSLLQFFKGKTEVYVIEDQDGFLENQIKMKFFNELDCKIFGKEYFPAFGEISLQQVHQFLLKKWRPEHASQFVALGASDELQERLGTFCEGCPHRSSFYAIDEVIKNTNTIIGGDIGCSSLPPQRADWLLCMNAGIGISQGMSQILKNQKVISTGGEGSFFHAGITSLQSAVVNKIDLLHIVFDNRSIAMTGHQSSPSADDRFDHMKLLESIGVDRFFELNAFDPLSFQNRLKVELETKGVRVLWVKGDCALLPNEETRIKRKTKMIRIENEKCGACTKCYSDLGCPAIKLIDVSSRDLKIDLDRCMRCGVCIEICPNNSIEVRYESPKTN
jgi:indolepyruvate ferredoxin oxidoreductase, alpha subunit